MPETVVSLKNIDKHYWLRVANQSLIGSVLRLFRKKGRDGAKKEICALKDIELCIKKGEAIGIIGENASGKTTLLRIISRITMPSRGQLRVLGKVAGLLDLGAGFHSELTGRENIYLDAALYGLGRNEIDDVYEKIVEFSGLGDFIDAQVKAYSQGMLVRLGFAIAIHVNPDIFLIDDSLAVGDEAFQRKCLNKITQLKEQGKTIIVVSHDLDSISRICERGILLQSGRIVKDDSIHKVILRYVEAVGNKESIASVDSKRMSVIFNSGKIILLWDGKPLTKNFGGYVSFQIRDKWIMFWGARWNVIENNDGGWKVQGVFDKYGMKLILECAIINESLLNFNFQLKSSRSIDLKKVSFGFMFSEKYDKFLKGECLEDIEMIKSTGQDWTDVYRTDEANAPLVLVADQNIPVLKLSFEKDECSSFRLIQSTGPELDAKVLQMQMKIANGTKIENTEGNVVENRAELEILDESEFEDFLQKLQSTRRIESKGLRLKLKNKRMQVVYNDLELTKGKEFTFGFYYSGHYFDLFDGAWVLQKDASNLMSLYSEFKDLKLRLKLFLSLDKNSIKWEIDVQGCKSPEIIDLLMQIYLTDKYEKYFDLETEQTFSSASEHAEQIKQGGLLGLFTQAYDLPAIAFEGVKGTKLKLQNASFDVPGRVLINKIPVSQIASGTIVFLDSLAEKTVFIENKQKECRVSTVLVENDLKIGFNKNRVSIYYKGIEITEGEGFCSGIHFKGRWYESKQLIKEISKEENKIKVIINRRVPEITELWEISLEGGAICWSVIVKSSVSLPELCCKAGIIIRPNYRQWVHSFHEGKFSDKVENNQVIDLDDSNNILLGLRTNKSEETFPVLFFEREYVSIPRGIIIYGDQKSSLLMFKFETEETINKNNEQKVFTGKIMLSNQNSWENNISKHRLQHFSLITDKRFQLISAFKEIRLLCDKKRLTEKCGLRVSLTAEGRKLYSKDAFWKIKKVGQDKIEVELTWKDFPILQKWCFRKDDEAIEWTVTLMLKQRLKLTKLFINIFSDFTFNYWINGKDKGSINLRKFETESITLFEKRSNFIGVYRDVISTETPALLLNPLVDMNEWFLHLYAYHKDAEMTWGAHCIIGPEGKFFASGNHEIFKARLFLLEDENKLSELIVSQKRENFPEISSGNLTVKVKDAKVRLYWKGQELTKTLGLYSAFFNGKDWVDSSLAKWQITVSLNKIVISLSWNQLLVFQRWELGFNDDELCWEMHTDIQQEGINSVIAALMLNDNYNYFQTESVSSKEFPADFKENRWEHLLLTKGGIDIKAENENFPRVIFEGLVTEHDYNNILENSDKLHSGRVLKCETKIVFSKNEGNNTICSKVKIRIKD